MMPLARADQIRGQIPALFRSFLGFSCGYRKSARIVLVGVAPEEAIVRLKPRPSGQRL